MDNSLSFTICRSLLRLMSIDLVMPSKHLLFCCLLLLPPASRYLLMSQLFASGDQNTGPSASASVPPMNIQGWYPLGWTGLISLQSGDSQESSPVPQFKSINSLAFSHLPFSKQRFSNMFAVYKSTCLWFSQIAYGLHRADHYSDEDLRLGNMISTSRVSCLVGSS